MFWEMGKHDELSGSNSNINLRMVEYFKQLVTWESAEDCHVQLFPYTLQATSSHQKQPASVT